MTDADGVGLDADAQLCIYNSTCNNLMAVLENGASCFLLLLFSSISLVALTVYINVFKRKNVLMFLGLEKYPLM